MNDQRKATDILLAVEEKIDQLNRYIQNFDNNMKILINRISLIEQNKSSKPKIPSVAPADFDNKAIGIVKKPAISISTPDEKPKKKKLEKSKSGKINVTQVVFDQNDGRLLWALVEIFTPDGKLIEKTKTNSGGRWMKELLPGEYNIKISKPHPEINMEYKINIVSNNENMVELEAKKHELPNQV